MAAGAALVVAGVLNGVAGFLGLFPGIFEASAAGSGASEEEPIRLASLLATPYGRYAIGHLLGACLQIGGGSCIQLLGKPPLAHGLLALGVVTLGLELWGHALKGALTVLSAPGFLAAALTGAAWWKSLRGRAG